MKIKLKEVISESLYNYRSSNLNKYGMHIFNGKTKGEKEYKDNEENIKEPKNGYYLNTKEDNDLSVIGVPNNHFDF